MKRFFKRFFWFTLLLALAGGGVGYYYGLRPNNYKQFFGELRDKYFPSQDQEGEDKTSSQEKTSTRNGTGKSSPSGKENLPSLPSNPFAKVDRLARACPKSAEKDVASLAVYLQKGTKNDLEKARAIYVWLTKNVSYDDDGYNSGNYGDLSAAGVLKSRKAVCSGFAALYQALGEAMGLEIKNVSGYAKGYGYTPGTKFKETDHAWNVIRIDGSWRVFDATWGEGYGSTVNGKLKSTKRFKPEWFNVDPYEAIFSHYPEDRSLTLVKPEISLKVYEKFPTVRQTYFALGFDGKSTYQTIRRKGYMELPKVYGHSTYLEIKEAPQFRDLNVGRKYMFRIYAPRALQMALTNAKGNWTYLKQEKGYFFFEYNPEYTGELSLNVQHEGGSWETVLKYTVSNKSRPS